MPKCLPVLYVLGINRYASNRTHLYALGCVKVTDAFGAFSRVDFVYFCAQVDRLIRALGLAHIAINAFVGDDQSHGLPSPQYSE